jgi:hypothetical protein
MKYYQFSLKNKVLIWIKLHKKKLNFNQKLKTKLLWNINFVDKTYGFNLILKMISRFMNDSFFF